MIIPFINFCWTELVSLWVNIVRMYAYNMLLNCDEINEQYQAEIDAEEEEK